MKQFKVRIGLLIVAVIWVTGFAATDIALRYFTPY